MTFRVLKILRGLVSRTMASFPILAIVAASSPSFAAPAADVAVLPASGARARGPANAAHVPTGFAPRDATNAAPRATSRAVVTAPANAVVKATLSNGLRVVIVRNALAPVISTDLTYLVGSRDDPADVPGMAHAQEHMMFRGTKNLTTSELGTIATALGGNFNAETSDTLTQFEFTVPASELDAILRIESDRMRDVLDAQAQWANERGAIEQEVLRDASSPGGDFFRDAQAFAFAGTPYAHQGVGTRAAFERLTGPRLKAFYERWYAPNNAVFVIAGDVDAARVLAQVRAYFETIPKRGVPAHAVAHLEPLVQQVIRRPTTLTYPLAALGFRLPGVTSPDFLASFLLQQVLGSQRGPLRALVDTGDALDAQWISMPYVPEGQLGLATAALAPGANPVAMTKRLEAIVREYAEHGVPQELFETTKRQSIAGQELSRNSIASLATDWATTIALDNEPSIAREQELLAGVTLAEVNAAAKRYLDPRHAVVGALTPSANASQSAPPAPALKGPEKPLEAQATVTKLPAWANALLEHIAARPAETAPVRTKLSNGMTLIIRPATISDSVIAYGAVRTNPALQEPPGKEGVSNVLEAMFAFGTQTRAQDAFRRAQDEIDATVGAGAAFGLETTSRSFERAVALLAENELRPRFDRATFEAARRRARAELETVLNGTGADAQRQASAKLLPAGDPGLREPTSATLRALSLDDVRAYYAKTFRPDLTTIVLVGNVVPDAARAVVEGEFGAWSAAGDPPQLELPTVSLNPPGEVRLHVPSLGQDSVSLQELVNVDRSSPQYYPLQLGNAILGGGSLGAEQSRLFRDLRQNAGLVYSIDSQFSAQKTRAQFSVEFASSPGNRDRIAALIDAEILKIQSEPVGDFELSLAKAAIARRSIVAGASIAAIGQSLLNDATNGFPLDQERLDTEAIVAATAPSVRDAFAAYIRPKDFVRIVIGP